MLWLAFPSGNRKRGKYFIGVGIENAASRRSYPQRQRNPPAAGCAGDTKINKVFDSTTIAF